NFDASKLSIDGASFPSANADITLGDGAPRGTTLAVNASEAQSGRITVLLSFDGPVPSGLGKRLVNLNFRIASGAGNPTVTIPDTEDGRQIVNGSGESLPSVYPDAMTRIAAADMDARRSKAVAIRSPRTRISSER